MNSGQQMCKQAHARAYAVGACVHTRKDLTLTLAGVHRYTHVHTHTIFQLLQLFLELIPCFVCTYRSTYIRIYMYEHTRTVIHTSHLPTV